MMTTHPNFFRLLLFILVAMQVAVPSAAAQTAPAVTAAANSTLSPTALLQNPFARKHESLAGRWQVIVDPAQIASHSPFEGFPPVAFQSATPWSNNMVLQEWSFDARAQFSVPGDWNSQDAKLFFYEGDVWYQREIRALPKTGERMLLYFGAVNYLAEVYLSGEKLARHEGGFTPFNIDITEAARKKLNGVHQLVVRVSNAMHAKTIPTRYTDWHNYGGITREVLLVTVPEQHVRDYFVRLTNLQTREVTADIKLGAVAAGIKVSVAITALGERQEGFTDALGRITLRWRTKAPLWSTTNPNLHEFVIRTETDEVKDKIGLRTVAVHGQKIMLNGAPIFLRGVAAHEESTLHPGRAYGRADAVAMLDLIRDLGGNFIRLAHYPHNEHVARLADERGILVWAEQPIYWGIDFASADVLANARAQASAMVLRDRNRAAVVLWSIANETPKNESRLSFLSELANTVRALDDTRPLTAALFGDPFAYARNFARIAGARLALDDATSDTQRIAIRAWLEKQPVLATKPLTDDIIRQWSQEIPSITIDDPLAQIVDVIGFNQYLGWYYEGPISRVTPMTEPQLRKISLELMPRITICAKLNKPIVISEFGADAKYNMRGEDTQIFTEEFQARFYHAQVQMIAKIPNLVGVSPWVLKDFRSPRRTLPGILDYWNRKGLVDETGQKKFAFDLLRKSYSRGGVFFGLEDARN